MQLLKQRHEDVEVAPPIPFANSAALTLGAEIEIQLIDTATLDLSPRANELLKNCNIGGRMEGEFFQSTVELKTGICTTVHDAAATLGPDLREIAGQAVRLDLGLCTTGCHPFARYENCRVSDSDRYQQLMDRHQWLTRRMTVYGLHIHIGMASAENCIRFQNAFLSYVPHMIALSASSPYWQGQDTGLASCRPTTYDSLPTAGQPYPLSDWREFEELVHVLGKCKAISSLKDLWWDIRPSPSHGTLEIRCCDGPATLAEALALMAFVHMVILVINDRIESQRRVKPPPHWMLRENKWRAIRHGLDAEIVTDRDGNVAPLRSEIESLIAEAKPSWDALGYESHIGLLRDVLSLGNSSCRQRAAFARRGRIDDVIRFNVKEFWSGQPIWSPASS